MQEASATNLLVLNRSPEGVRENAATIASGAYAWDEFFKGKLRNQHTRSAYLRAVRRFLEWVRASGLALNGVTPGMVGDYFDDLQLSVPSKKVHMAAIRTFFDALVTRQVMALNPALSVRMERYSVVEGRTPEISVEQAKTLLDSIDLNTHAGFRDRAVIATLIYTAARAGAVAKLRVGDLVQDGTQLTLRFAEKGGKARSIPVQHKLEKRLREYLFVGGLENEPKTAPLFRSIDGRSGRLLATRMTGVDICRMVKRRLKAAGLPPGISPHSFRSCTATDLLKQNIALEEVQYLLGHSDSRVTKLYDRRRKEVTRNIVERISV